MTNPNSQERLDRRRAVRKEYVIGQSDDCSHPDSRRTYLGHQGASAFYQCQRCETVLVISNTTKRRPTTERGQGCKP